MKGLSYPNYQWFMQPISNVVGFLYGDCCRPYPEKPHRDLALQNGLENYLLFDNCFTILS